MATVLPTINVKNDQVWEEPTAHLRWCAGVLEQMWLLRSWSTVDYEWRRVKDATEMAGESIPSPSQTPSQHSDKE